MKASKWKRSNPSNYKFVTAHSPLVNLDHFE